MSRNVTLSMIQSVSKSVTQLWKRTVAQKVKRFVVQLKNKNVLLFKTVSAPSHILPNARTLKKKSVTLSMTPSTARSVQLKIKRYVGK